MQAKDLPDADVLRVVEDCRAGKVPYSDGVPAPQGRWCHVLDVEDRFPGVHERVILAKMKALIRRKLITGCACGCRGDFELTDKGLAFLSCYG